MSAIPDETPQTTTSTSPLALPAPEQGTSLAIGHSVKLDELGPMVVNSDGTLSRIANWKSMTPQEQERTMRVLGARNKQAKIRIANEEAKLQAEVHKPVGNPSTDS